MCKLGNSSTTLWDPFLDHENRQTTGLLVDILGGNDGKFNFNFMESFLSALSLA